MRRGSVGTHGASRVQAWRIIVHHAPEDTEVRVASRLRAPSGSTLKELQFLGSERAFAAYEGSLKIQNLGCFDGDG